MVPLHLLLILPLLLLLHLLLNLGAQTSVHLLQQRVRRNTQLLPDVDAGGVRYIGVETQQRRQRTPETLAEGDQRVASANAVSARELDATCKEKRRENDVKNSHTLTSCR